MERVKFIIFFREDSGFFTGWERVKQSSSTFAGRKRVKIDHLFCGDNIISFTSIIPIIHSDFLERLPQGADVALVGGTFKVAHGLD